MPDDRPNSQPTTRRAKDGRGAASDLAATQDPRFHEIPRERVADRVAQELLRLIAGGSLVPGERLPGERQLAQMMNVSRVSVRAALQQLKAQGLVSATQGGSTRIIASSESLDRGLGRLVRADLRNLLDLAELRAQLEAWAARRAARLGKPEQIEEIARLFEVMADPARDPKHKAEDDFAFHMAIARASDSPVYLHLLSVLGDIFSENCAFHRFELCPTPADDRRFLAEHRAVLEAIRAGDEAAAARAMMDHLSSVIAAYSALPERTASAAGGNGR
ncbi:MAG: FCD domain-containing protein [Kiloniellales bacterium]|nr:FCD domain-containing protein [Kiloniellales bacterium]MDJ0982397.1 FCD domain-containing protein [Kiloniellales bacterium]